MTQKSLQISVLLGMALLAFASGCRGSGDAARAGFPFSAAAIRPSTTTDETDMPEITLPESRVRAPEFPESFAWVNTDRPLQIGKELKGRVVVLDFWTYCCINCMHVLPDLAYIEQKYAGKPVIVIGVHSAKFDNEGDSKNINTACQRYEIEHPVIVDESHRIWSEYGVRAWPTLAVVDPEGRVVGTLSGEGNREILDAVVAALLEEGEAKGTLAAGPPEYKQQARVPSASGLAFPGKVLVDETGKLLFISDSNHNRIVVSDTEGNVLHIIGGGENGSADGSFAEAQFNRPQGMAYDAANRILYIADTENHTIRKADLAARTVATISGTGEQVYDRTGGGIGTAQGLNSPWDLTLSGNTLYVAMAGPHQLWTLDLASLKADAWVGSGVENIRDGNGTSSAALAQPSGLAIDGDWLYFADSEVSAVRRANLKTRDVETLIGTGLFDFGDKVGTFPRTLLQHPLGVAVYEGDVLVADTYNHRVKRLDLDMRESSNLVGSGSSDISSDSPAQPALYEPGGLSVFGDLLYVADTNHDRVLRVNLKTGEWGPIALKGLRTEQMMRMNITEAPLSTITTKPGEDLRLRLSAELPKGVHLNAEAPVQWSFAGENGSSIRLEGSAETGKLPAMITVPAASITPGQTYSLMLFIAYCTNEDAGLCIPAELAWRIRIDADTSAPDYSELSAAVMM